MLVDWSSGCIVCMSIYRGTSDFNRNKTRSSLFTSLYATEKERTNRLGKVQVQYYKGRSAVRRVSREGLELPRFLRRLYVRLLRVRDRISARHDARARKQAYTPRPNMAPVGKRAYLPTCKIVDMRLARDAYR